MANSALIPQPRASSTAQGTETITNTRHPCAKKQSSFAVPGEREERRGSPWCTEARETTGHHNQPHSRAARRDARVSQPPYTTSRRPTTQRTIFLPCTHVPHCRPTSRTPPPYASPRGCRRTRPSTQTCRAHKLVASSLLTLRQPSNETEYTNLPSSTQPDTRPSCALPRAGPAASLPSAPIVNDRRLPSAPPVATCRRARTGREGERRHRRGEGRGDFR